jgi:3',5'-cyclic AMP phosphodiesterase CpdA
MRQYALKNQLKTDCLFMLGDSWYGEMPGGVNDPRWQTQFEQMYPADVFPGPAYQVMGNHDYQRMPMSKRDMELEYAKRPKTRWTQPGLWYSYTFPSAPETVGQKPLLKVIALDSNVPRGALTNPADFTLTKEEHDRQLAWMKAEIAKPTDAAFLVVMGHHPIFSNGRHGDHPVLVKEWEPLLREAKAHFYFAGHDHDLQHLEFEGHPTSFVMSGAGGADLYDLKIQPKDRGPYAQRVYGFTHLEITPEVVTVRHLDADGHVLHAFEKYTDHSVKVLA